MTPSRDWAAPLTIGSVMRLAAVGLHVARNLLALERHVLHRCARRRIGGATRLPASGFPPPGGVGRESPFVAPAKALTAAPKAGG